MQAAYECWQLGAAVVHIHTRAADGKGAMNTQAFREIVEGIRAHKDCDVIINCTSSGASPEHPATDEERFLHHMTVPGIEMGSYDAGSFNWMPGGVFVNSPQFLQKLGDAYLEKGIKPEIEIFDAGMLGIADYFVKKGHLSTPCHYQFCLGVLGGMPATVENLIYLKDRIPAGSTAASSSPRSTCSPPSASAPPPCLSCTPLWRWADTSAWGWRITSSSARTKTARRSWPPTRCWCSGLWRPSSSSAISLPPPPRPVKFWASRRWFAEGGRYERF